ncbi:MAG: sulfurtransferase complex subunit TusB [Gammaproteobacteria bacterium]|nr:sulfurtransferase complex subunit TusB [Gammaproteobacteria bacterium]MBU1490874.1 sulfurtransferase complex subunit TusB [Gammaproteobacteria bacterium]MBU2067560.1 sulfurtransferase complex subunit TusB [Gammaproteobacteria bacterium]MBU2139630.1 sulfurtransferase complex subunit TusB [Gammaproteobacteria bacterium]MBU2215245.1 sulfurtransferase complex subunit TusB [Gammaproteobacteria bacterium]
MTTLHLLSHSPYGDDRLSSCLRLCGAEDGLLLCGDAVYALQPASAARKALASLPSGAGLYVLAEDLQARNIQADDAVTAVDYAAFVALTLRYDKVNSWL